MSMDWVLQHVLQDTLIARLRKANLYILSKAITEGYRIIKVIMIKSPSRIQCLISKKNTKSEDLIY